MVPFEGTREMSVSVQGGNVRVATTNPDVVRIGPFGSDAQGLLSFENLAQMKKRNTCSRSRGLALAEP
jgi:hypothetical protein